MKSILTQLSTLIGLIVTTLILTSFYYQAETRDLGNVLLDSRNIFIQKKIPVEFLFSFEKGERVSIRYRENAGSNSRGDIDDLTVRIRNLTTGSIELVPLNGYAFTAPSSGNYQLRFETQKRIRLDVRVAKKTEIEAGSEELVEMFSLRNLLVGIEVLGKANIIKRPTFKLKLGEGESVVINSGDDDSGVVKFTLNGKNYMFGQMAKVEQAGDYDVELYIPLDREDLKFGLKDLVGIAKDSKQKMLSDLSVSVKVPYIPEIVVNEDGTVTELDDNSEEEANRLFLENLFNNSQQGAEDLANKLGENSKETIGLMIDYLREVNRRDTVLVVVPKAEDSYSIPVAGLLDIEGKSRVCQNLGLSGDAAFWTYFIGVGEDMEKIYDEKDRRAAKNDRQGRGLGLQYAEAIKNEVYVRKQEVLGEY